MAGYGTNGLVSVSTGVHGYFLFEQTVDITSKLGHMFLGVSGAMELVSDHATFLYRYCTIVRNHELLIESIENASAQVNGGSAK